ncbi:hypothetical protein HYQ46_005651 [Verticillium longisporum]|nr:hypothetical protein HYQ46_005651 [Verticillium longisporum]
MKPPFTSLGQVRAVEGLSLTSSSTSTTSTSCPSTSTTPHTIVQPAYYSATRQLTPAGFFFRALTACD